MYQYIESGTTFGYTYTVMVKVVASCCCHVPHSVLGSFVRFFMIWGLWPHGVHVFFKKNTNDDLNFLHNRYLFLTPDVKTKIRYKFDMYVCVYVCGIVLFV